MVRFMANSINPINLENLKRLGIDEISLVKGQGKFIVVLYYLMQHKINRIIFSKNSKRNKKSNGILGTKGISYKYCQSIHKKDGYSYGA